MFDGCALSPVTRCRKPTPLRQQQVEQTLFRIQFGLVGDVFELLFAHHVDRDLDQIADHRLHIAAHVADFGELRGFDLQERRVRQLGQPARNLGLSHAGGPDHDDVLGDDLFRQLRRQLLPPHAIAQRNRHRALRGVLAHNVLVELADDLTRSQIVECELLFFCGSR